LATSPQRNHQPQNIVMRTKEDYLKKKIGDSDNPIYYNQNIHDAMQEYADEQSVAFACWIRDSAEYRNEFSNGLISTTELLHIFKNENK